MQGNDSNALIDDGCPYASITDARDAHQRFHDARAVRQRPAADDDRGGGRGDDCHALRAGTAHDGV
ncbi:hypothetical protein WT10_10715 [Burkholderia stagnalis]|nr:hypothetical protein WS59_20870 [Burkholderia stagnalis]KVN21819.1 hypothetical protein WT10_10715 [Burkholderia stagnalis]KWI65298.1 hypothetical protein WT75_28030 [Burkholderia stagnalis]KWK62993.1 hypothetical protein WT82_02125 [Burkholderia stagnalis]KWN24893.1 hypothetical protein WT84_05965 [Burkholderia stagnalis]